ncbi:hypothetical protein TNCV_2455131 [Trichonephila clavipes]|nr:hypothetical protein TNCV_2455131 [Trichonephila clavipes]
MQSIFPRAVDRHDGKGATQRWGSLYHPPGGPFGGGGNPKRRSTHLGQEGRFLTLHHWVRCGPRQRVEIPVSLLQKRRR